MKDNLWGKKFFPQSYKDEVTESAVDGQINMLRLEQRCLFQERWGEVCAVLQAA